MATEQHTVQLNVADVPIMKLLKTLAAGGFCIKSDAAGTLHLTEQASAMGIVHGAISPYGAQRGLLDDIVLHHN